ncbi:hypothetical protein GYMLUDRAFT_250925 [Collybiopsis luxurians FD-317 M1]|uniref:Uncharacterized protein n=1 Tax=Collybiopsis luxurians FD-317 M1 TaxID=944289 RepID=A0A0D0BDX4_9AGAR|nr:hypothetical protein GYMLUDRAFT_250925 [Collybiopsis luxurians FD-317 M1]
MAKPTIYENDSDKIGFAVSYLTGAAATHYDNLLKQEEAGIPVPALCTWIDFVAEFTLSLDVTVAAQTHPPQNYPQWVQRFQELDNSICATNAAHSRGGNSGFGTYNPMAPSNPQNSNPQQGSNSNNPQQAGGQQGRNQGNWNNRQRGAAAWDSNVNSDNISGTVYGQSEDFTSASSQNGNSGEGLENQGGNVGVSKNPGDKEFLWAI